MLYMPILALLVDLSCTRFHCVINRDRRFTRGSVSKIRNICSRSASANDALLRQTTSQTGNLAIVDLPFWDLAGTSKFRFFLEVCQLRTVSG